MMSGRGCSAWHAAVLRDEAERLAIACRQLEHRLGWFEGRAAGVPEECGCNEEAVLPGCAVHYTPVPEPRVVEVEIVPTLRGGEIRRAVGVR